MEIQIKTEKFHESNHTTCAESFKSSEYYDLDNSNTQACEQTNSKLRSIATSCAFMNPDLFMKAILLYLGYHNILKL